MTNIRVRFLDKSLEEGIDISVAEGSDIEDLLHYIEPQKKSEDYFYIINGSIVFSSYKLQENDNLLIFPAMCGG